jgi:oligopeptide transport system substrate-binding protein
VLFGKNLRSFRAASAILIFFALTISLVSCTKKVDEKDNSINFPVRANVKGLDPLRANDIYSAYAIAQVYQGLLQFSYLKRPIELEPCLADGMPQISDNGLTYTFKIKQGVLFQDDPAFTGGKGRELVAADFIYSWKRLADPSNTSEGFWVFDGKVKGLNQWADAIKNGKADYSTPVEGLQAPDKYTLVIKLIQPYYQLTDVLAHAFTTVVPKEAVEKYGREFINHPVGTGPFRLESWVRNSKLTFVRNPTYRKELYPSEGSPGDKENGLLADAGKPLPFADKFVINEIIEDQPRWQNFMKGNLDFVEIPNDNFDSSMKGKNLSPEMTAKGIQLTITPDFDVVYNAFNMKDPILGKNKYLRQALAFAQDNEGFVKKFYNGRGLAAQGPIPPDVDGYDPNYQNPYNKFDLEKAKEFLKKAGYEGGKGLPEFTLEAMSGSKERQMAEFFQQAAAAIGVVVKINTNTWPQFQEKIKNGKAQIFAMAWSADYPDGQDFLQLFYGKNLSPGPNDTGFQNAAFDKLYEQSLALPPGPARSKLYMQMRDIVVEEVPWTIIAYRTGYRTYHGWMHNFKWNAMAFDLFKYMRVDGKERAALKSKL